MKHNKILNRPMFNAQNSAYGRGITSNLVTEEQRQRFNDGGRVALGKGDWLMNIGKKIPGVDRLTKWGASKIPKKLQPGAINPAAWKTGLTQPGFSFGKIGTGAGYGGTKWGAGELPFFKSVAGKGAGIATAIGKKIQRNPALWGTGTIGGVLGGWKLFGGKDEDLPTATGDGQWEEKLQVTKKPTEVMETETLDWTDQEKKEKMGQIQLKLAQRLVSGARDKWGSKEQMKNIGDWFGDVAAIGDKAELRKDERKYKAMGKAYKDIAQAAYDRQNNYMGMINAGSDHPTALARTTGITGAQKLSVEPDLRKDQIEKIQKMGPGTFYFDEAINKWQIFTPDGVVTVTVDQLQDAVKTGKIEKMTEPAETKVVETKKVIEGDDDLVTQAGTKGIIPFDPENPNFQVMLN